MNGEKYMGNRSPSHMEVHDLDLETGQCQIDEILRAHHEVPFTTLEAAHAAGFDNCAYCLGNSRR